MEEVRRAGLDKRHRRASMNRGCREGWTSTCSVDLQHRRASSAAAARAARAVGGGYNVQDEIEGCAPSRIVAAGCWDLSRDQFRRSSLAYGAMY